MQAGLCGTGGKISHATGERRAGQVGRLRQLSEEAFLEDFAGGVDPGKAHVLYAVPGRIADTLFASRTTAAAWKLRPSWYAVSKQDRTTSPELERFLASRMRAKTIEVDAGHLSLITHRRRLLTSSWTPPAVALTAPTPAFEGAPHESDKPCLIAGVMALLLVSSSAFSQTADLPV